MVAVGAEPRERLFSRLLHHTRLQWLLEEQGVSMPLREMLTIYRVPQAVPASGWQFSSIHDCGSKPCCEGCMVMRGGKAVDGRVKPPRK